MATVTKPIALDESLNTTEQTPRNVADVLAQELARIAGRQASDVEYDNTDSGLTADNVQDAIDELKSDIPTVNDGTLTIQQNGDTKGTFTANQSGNSTVNIEIPTTDIQTAVDEFETYNGGLLSSLKVSLSPNQDLHGYLEPWVGGAGKNKAEQTVAKIKSLNTSGTWSGNAYTWNGITYTILTDDANNVIGYDVDGTATARGWLFISDTDFGNDDIIYNGTTRNGYTFTSGNSDYLESRYYCFYGWSQKKSWILVDIGLTKSHDKWYPMARLSSESDPTFEPYSNICPISGHTQVDVDVSDGDTTQEQVTVNLGGTYYSGILDVVTGVFTPDTADEIYDGSVDETWNMVTGDGYHQFATSRTDLSNTTNAFCNEFKNISIDERGQKTGFVNYLDTTIRAALKDSDILITSVADWRTFLSNNPLQVNYELANPTPIQLSPTMVKALVGENHLSAPLDGQEITESKYKQMFTFDDVIAYIQSLS